MSFDGDDAQDFFGSDHANQDGYAGDGDYRGDADFCGDGKSGSVGGDTDQHVDSGMPGPGRTFVPLDSTRRPNEITTDR